MRIDIAEIQSLIDKYFHVNKFEQQTYEELIKLLNLGEIVINHNGLNTIDIVEVKDKINILLNKDNTPKIYKNILNDLKNNIEELYYLNYDNSNYKYASISKLKIKKRYKKVDIMRNPNIVSIDNEFDYDVKYMKVFITLIDGSSLEGYVIDWKGCTNENNVIGSFNCSGGNDRYNQKHIIKAEEYSK